MVFTKYTELNINQFEKNCKNLKLYFKSKYTLGLTFIKKT